MHIRTQLLEVLIGDARILAIDQKIERIFLPPVDRLTSEDTAEQDRFFVRLIHHRLVI